MPLPNLSLGDLTISATFCILQSDIYTHFMVWLYSCVEVREKQGFDLLSLPF